MSEPDALLDLAEQAVDAGIARLADAGEGWSARRFKASGEEVTAADLEVEEVVSAVLRRHSPGVPVIGEETAVGTTLPPRCWLLDPIDGTMNFTRGSPFHAISLAYVEDRLPRLGVVDAPALGRRWHTGQQGCPPPSAPVARTVDEAVIGLTGTGSGDPRRIGLLQSTAYRIRMHGAMSLDLVGVAEGWLDACVCLRPRPWDVAAGTALVRKRGGAVLGAGGREFAFDSPVLVAGHTALARAVLRLWESRPAEGG
ncbi:inositol monophosphatase family protein [Streptomyces sp. MCA2]|uniref:inositol monophosphatase family protein n=1 Tax=Streptomyces sp. MCA2 TaxID=2944805 RepID=UPI0020229387|nr:inositol monophosphatase family protein [Streptomyces sp. MCA2]MCL7494086.1 inositol monophosphatase family protein [Streptomyces sp. MCA2]